MFIVSGGRGTGKTRRLLEAAQITSSVVACKDPVKMIERAYKYGITGLTIIPYEDIQNTGTEATIYIHDIETFIKYAFPNITGFSETIE